MIKWMNKRVKKMDTFDVGLVKWSTVAFVLWLLAIWPAAMAWVQSVNPWYFFVAFMIFAARPFYRIYLK